MSSVFISTLQTAEGKPAHRSSSRSAPDAIKSRLFSHRSAPRSSAKAPVSGLGPPPRKAAPEVQNFLHLLVQHRGQRATSAHLPRSCSQHLLKFPYRESLRVPEDCGRRFMIPPQGPAPVSGVFPMGGPLHLLEIRIQAIQLSPYHADLPARHPIRLGMTADFLACYSSLHFSDPG